MNLSKANKPIRLRRKKMFKATFGGIVGFTDGDMFDGFVSFWDKEMTYCIFVPADKVYPIY